METLSQRTPVFFSANMSYGVHALTKILETAVPHFKISISNLQKRIIIKSRCSSGTLVKLYDVIKELRDNVSPVYDRHEKQRENS